MTAGIAVGEQCARCVHVVARKASRIGRLVAAATTLALVGYLVVALRMVAPPWGATARTVGAVAAVAWYLLTYRIARRVALEWVK